ncbi:MAG: putative tRNA (Guanosine-2-O-)-methyltransferase [Chlamydiales bacterium]|jgi:tRNA G18 (ribose-2'-O)-methylase SpoU|nr:putative tRNA (Guanosine-2-O-)-methyltransferase [Chlamydiales bacterium]
MFTKSKFQKIALESQHKKCSEHLRALYEALLEGRPEKEIYIAQYHLFAEWMGLSTLSENLKEVADRFHFHLRQAKLGIKEHRLLPSIRQNDRHTSASPLPVAIYLDRLRSCHNVGSIIRTVEALSLGTIYASEHVPFIEHPGVQSTSMGCWQWVEGRQNIPLELLPRPLLVLETAEGASSISSYPFPETFTLVVGNEEDGCSQKALELADDFLEIPLVGRKNSLNVANAFAMAAYEIARQRKRL